MTFDFHKATIIINKEGKLVILHGDQSMGSLQTISCKCLSKLLNQKDSFDQGYLFVIKSCSEDSSAEVASHVHPRIQEVVNQYQDVFSEPSKLPPARSHDHHIPLMPGSAHVNQRGYRMPYSQKLELEKQVKHMLEKEIIQVRLAPSLHKSFW